MQFSEGLSDEMVISTTETRQNSLAEEAEENQVYKRDRTTDEGLDKNQRDKDTDGTIKMIKLIFLKFF